MLRSADFKHKTACPLPTGSPPASGDLCAAAARQVVPVVTVPVIVFDTSLGIDDHLVSNFETNTFTHTTTPPASVGSFTTYLAGDMVFVLSYITDTISDGEWIAGTMPGVNPSASGAPPIMNWLLSVTGRQTGHQTSISVGWAADGETVRLATPEVTTSGADLPWRWQWPAMPVDDYDVTMSAIQDTTSSFDRDCDWHVTGSFFFTLTLQPASPSPQSAGYCCNGANALTASP